MEDPTHFKGKDAARHVAEAEAQGIISAAEIHGVETPGYISAIVDAARETAILFFLFLPLLLHLENFAIAIPYAAAFLIGWSFWKGARASLLGWGRLERLHRVLEQEKWEIEHNRPQEKAELRELYRAKGFEGKLLEEVLDVLMADGDRLLKVMVEEELGLSLANVEHPLKQGVSAGIGALGTGLLILLSIWIGIPLLSIAIALFIVAISSGILAKYARNELIPSIVWSLSLSLFVFGLTYYVFKIL